MLGPLVDQLIRCREDCTLRHLESLAMIGLVQDVEEEVCTHSRFKRIKVRLFDGGFVSSACYFEEEVKQSIVIIRTYINIAKENNAIGKLQIVKLAKSD